VSWLGAEPTLDAVFGLRPELFAAWRAFRDVFWEQGLVDPTLLELCRLRVAALHGCAAELATRTPAARASGLGEAKIAALADWATDARFDARERACLRFAEQFVLDPHAITDADAAAVVAALGEPGFVALIETLALFDGFCRFRLVLGVQAEA
jgi:alkylhydroperoxidase family enzyme